MTLTHWVTGLVSLAETICHEKHHSVSGWYLYELPLSASLPERMLRLGAIPPGGAGEMCLPQICRSRFAEGAKLPAVPDYLSLPTLSRSYFED